MSETKKTSIFKSGDLPLDRCHVKSVMPFSNIDQELFKKYYSPSALSLDLVLDAVKILEGFYSTHLIEKDNARIFFPRDTIGPFLILYDVPVWADGDWCSKETARHSMVIAIAPRARGPNEKCDEFPKLADLEAQTTKEKEGQP